MLHVLSVFLSMAAGGSTPPGISAPTVTSIPSPISVNGFTGMPPPQANGQPPAEAVFTNGIHHYPGKPDEFNGINERIMKKLINVFFLLNLHYKCLAVGS